MRRSQLYGLVKKLNNLYGLKVRFKTVNDEDRLLENKGISAWTAWADYDEESVSFPRLDALNNPHLLAHEYAHIIDGWQCKYRAHDRHYDGVYREVCNVLGLSYKSHITLIDELKRSVIDELGYDPGEGEDLSYIYTPEDEKVGEQARNGAARGSTKKVSVF